MATNTTATFQTHNGNGSTANFAISFSFLENTEVDVSVGGVLKTLGTHYNISGSSVTFTSGNIPPSGTGNISFRRNTNISAKKVDFADGSVLTETDLDNNSDQILFAQQEVINDYVKRDGSQTITGNLVFEGATDDDNETTLAITDPTDDRTITVPDITGTLITDADTGTVSNQMIANDAVTNAKIADNQIDSEHYVDGSIDNVHLANDAVNGNKIADDSINSEHYVDGSIDTQHIAADQITNALIADDQIDSEHYVDGSIDRQHLEADIIDSTKLADDAVGTEHIQANAVTDSEIATGTLDNRYYTETELNAGQLDNRYFTETELTGGALDGRYYTETEAEALFLRQDSSETIASGQTWSNSDAFVATTAAINARIVDLIDDVGGFTVIANENSFPNTNPQGSAGQSAILSIGAVTTTLTPSSGIITLPNGRLNNGQVLITGVTSVIPQGFGLLVESTSTDHTYTFHRLVPKATEVTTVASNITNIAAAGANVVDINNFADIYQISNNPPQNRADGSNLQEGDLWFDNSNDNLRVYDGTNWNIITPAQSVLNDISIVSGAITYAEDLGLITDAVATGSSNGSLDIVADILEDEITFTVTAATGKFIIDGVDKPALTLYKGWTYTFDVSDNSNGPHPLRFQSNGNPYSTNVTVTGTQGQAGAKVVIKIPESQPTSFQYYCTNHSGMGNTITVKDDPIKTVSDNITNILAAANNNTNVSAVAGNAANINAVAGVATEIGRLGTVDAVADMNTLGTSAIVTDMDTLADIASNITTVANNDSNVTAVANNSTNINAAVSNASNINTVSGISANVTSVASNNTNVTTVASSIANVNTAATNIANINTAASNVTDINNFADRYRVASSAPTTNNDEGDLYFDTTSDELRVYNGTSWQGGVTATGNLAGLGANTFTGDQTVNANIIVSGTVDGKDISALGITGTTLDNGVTATTQTQSDNSTKVSTTAYVRTAIGNVNTDLVVDSTPQLGGDLDGQNNDLTNIGTINGANLQLDFGTI